MRGRLRDGATATLIVVLGSLAELAFFDAARGDPGLARIFRATVAVGLALVVGALAVAGFREDGLPGAAYRLWHPLGTILDIDDPPWTWFAVGWLVVLGCVLVGLLTVR